MQTVAFLDCHLHLADYPGAGQVVRSSQGRGILLLAVSTDKESSRRSLSIARSHPEAVRPFIGVHPSEAERSGEKGWLEEMLPEAAGIGEIGLDPKYSQAGPGSRQAAVYESQLRAAEKSGKPVQVHARGAEEACLQELSRFSLRRVLLHWFEGEDLLPEVQDRGYFISFGPALLYSRKLQRIAASFERSQAMTETDGPVAFVPLGGIEGPLLVPSVVFRLAELWKLSFEDARDVVFHNGLRYLGGPGKG